MPSLAGAQATPGVDMLDPLIILWGDTAVIGRSQPDRCGIGNPNV